MKSRTAIIWLIVLVFIIPFAAYFGLQWYNQRWHSLPVHSELNGGTEKDITAFRETRLINQDGKTVSLSNAEGNIMVVDFFFTHCPAICPKMTRSLQKVRRSFAGDNSVHLYSISVDPENDSIPQLQQYSKRFGIDLHYWDLLTGNKKEIYRLARNNFKVTATDGDGGPADFIHSEKLILIDKRQRIREYYNGTDAAEVSQLIKDIKKLKNENE